MYYTKKDLEKKKEILLKKKTEWENLKTRLNKENYTNRLEQFINISNFEYHSFNSSYYFDLFLTLSDFKDNRFSINSLKEVKYYTRDEKAIVLESPASIFAKTISLINYDNNLYTKLLKSLALLPNENLYEKWLIINEEESLSKDDSKWESVESLLNSYPNKIEVYKFDLIKVYSSLNVKQIKELHTFIIENNNVPKNYLSLNMSETLNLLTSLANQGKANEALQIISFVDFNIYENSSWLTYAKSFGFLEKIISSLNLNPTMFDEKFMKEIALKPYVQNFTSLRNSFSTDEQISQENALSIRNMLLSNKKQVVASFIEENQGKIDLELIFKDNDFTYKFFSDNKYWIWKNLEANNIKNIDNVYYGNSLLEMAMRRPSLVGWKYKNMFFDELKHIINIEAFEAVIDKLPHYLRSLCKENMDAGSNSGRVNMAVVGNDRPSYSKYSHQSLYNNNLLDCDFDSSISSPYFYHDSKLFLNVLKSKNIINDENIENIFDNMKKVYLPLHFYSDVTVSMIKKDVFLELVLLDNISKNNNKKLDFYNLIESVNVYDPIKKYDDSSYITNPRSKFGILIINSILEVSDNSKDNDLKNFAMNRLFFIFNESIKKTDIKERNLLEDLNLMYLSFNKHNFNFSNLNENNLNDLSFFSDKVDVLINYIKEDKKNINNLGFDAEQANIMLDYFSTNCEKTLMSKEVVSNNEKKRHFKF